MLSLSLIPVNVTATGLPTIDIAALIQKILAIMKQGKQYSKQIEEYRKQLNQLQNQLQNTLTPSVYLWDDAQITMDALINTIDTLEHYKTQLGSLNSYLNKFKDEAYWKNSPCFSAAGCTASQRAILDQSIAIASESQKRVNDNTFRGIISQQSSIKADARRLRQLQSNAQSATGRLEAIQYATQIASQQSNQLLHLRSILVAQQNAIVTRNQALANKEAIYASGRRQAYKRTFSTGTNTSYGLF